MPPQTLSWQVTAPSRLDRALRERFPHLSRKNLKAWLHTQEVLVNERKAQASTRLQVGDTIAISDASALLLTHPQPSTQQLPVLHQDAQVLILDKPAGLPSHPLHAWEEESAAQAALAHDPSLQGIGEARAPGLLHRLDNDTSGVLVFARTHESYDTLRQALQARQWRKWYLAQVEGHLQHTQTLHSPIAHHPTNKRKMLVLPESPPFPKHRGHPQEAISHIQPLSHSADTTLVLVEIVTGVRHQIRVHLAALGHPICGDPLYHPAPQGHLMLHAWKVALPSPPLPKPLLVSSPPPFGNL